MPAGTLSDIKDILHELAPWAAVALAAISAHQAFRAKEHGKEAVVVGKEAAAKADTAAVKADVAAVKAEEAAEIGKVAAEKIDNLHVTVNGRMEQLVAAESSAARQEGHTRGVAEEAARQRGGSG